MKNTASECILSVENNRFEVCWGGATDPYGNELQTLPLSGCGIDLNGCERFCAVGKSIAVGLGIDLSGWEGFCAVGKSI